jgi:hypothetical protein
MFKQVFSIVIILGLTTSLSAQELYLPRDVQKAYAKETRSKDGKPGKNYWQNSARYNISITAMPPDRNIRGRETITYFNNSNDTLGNPAIKLFLNIHKPGAPRDQGATADYLTSGMKINTVKVNGAGISWVENPYFITVQSLRLPQPLLPHDSVNIEFDWQYEISVQSGREGMIDSTSWFLAYFYPRISVYDDYAGWDRMSFTDGKEFYSDFNDYTVTVNVPKNYIVWGTGTLQQPEKILQPEYLKKFRESFNTDQVIRIVTKEDLAKKQVTAQNAVNSWTFTARQIPDMAFGISDHYNWDGSSVVVDEITGKRASAQSAYNDAAKDFPYVTGYIRHSLKWFSAKWPGITYPYEKLTIFQGFADMEYPMMCNNSSQRDTVFSRFVAEHEIAHMYMPFYMGTNETRYGFMDEGWATALEYLIGIDDLGSERADQLFKMFRVNGWINDASQSQDIPIITPTNDLNGAAMGNNEYGKAALGYLAVKDILGDEDFKLCLQAYMDRWHGKHPTPWDFFYTFNDVAEKNLNWFWNSWFFTNNYIDMAIKGPVKTKTGYTLTLDNLGGMPAPVDVVVNYDDNTSEKLHQSPSIWEKNPKQAVINLKTTKKISTVKLDSGIYMDADASNNIFTTK